MPRRSSQRYSQREDDFIVSDVEIENDVVQARRRPSSQTQRDGFSALTEQQQDDLKQRFIRFMLSRNARKRPVRRAELTKHLFHEMDNVGSKQRVFAGTMQRAQTAFKTIYGMDIVELRRRPRRIGASASQRMASQSASASAGTVNKAYILVSNLPDHTRVEDETRMAEIGLLTVIAAMIILTPGCRISDTALYKELERLGIFVKDHSDHKQINSGNVRELVEKEWPEQWYLERDKDDNGNLYSIGPRLYAEAHDEDLIEFIDAVYSITGDSATRLDETARRELKQRIENARKAFGDDDDDQEN